MTKYHNRKTTVDGITFDSKAEAERYQELVLLQKSGVISNLKLQPTFELIPTFKKNGKTYRKTVYKADFSYFDNYTELTLVEDVKGVKTPVYKIKKKLFEYLYKDYTILEITKGGRIR